MKSKHIKKTKNKNKKDDIKIVKPSKIYATVVSKAPTPSKLLKSDKSKEEKKGGQNLDYNIPRLSPAFGYALCKKLDGTIDTIRGTTSFWGQRAGKGYGNCEKKFYDIDTNLSPQKYLEIMKKTIPPEAFKNALKYRTFAYERLYDINDILRVIWINRKIGNNLVIACFNIFESFLYPSRRKKGEIPTPLKNEKCLGGHSVLIKGFRTKKKQLIFQNWWGPKWGHKGRGYLPFKYIDEHLIEAWVSIKKEYWLKNKQDIGSTKWNKFVFKYYKIHSLVYGRPILWVLDIYDKDNQMVGWAHFRIVDCGNVIEIEDLFVKPEYQNNKIGTQLLEAIENLSKGYLIPKIRCYIHIQDLIDDKRQMIVENLFRKKEFNINLNFSKFPGCYWKASKRINYLNYGQKIKKNKN